MADDLDRRLARLRGGLRDRIERPPAGLVLSRARRRVTNHRAQIAVVAVVALLAITVPLATMLAGRHRTAPAAPSASSMPVAPTTVTVTERPSTSSAIAESSPAPSSTSSGTAGQSAPPSGTIPNGRLVYAADFRAPGHVYVLVGTPGADGAVTMLYATDDAGKTWAQHATPLPVVTGDDGYSADLVVLGRDRLLLRQPLSSDLPWGFSTWFSADGGTTWSSDQGWGEAGTNARTASTIPAGAVLTTTCTVAQGEHPDRCAGWQFEVVDPTDGRLSVLTTQPDLEPLQAQWIEPAADGRWWVAGTVDGVPAVAVTADGTSWAVHQVPVEGTGTPTGVSVVTVGSYAWAVVRGVTDTEKNALLGISVSRDNGATWSGLLRPTPGTAPRTVSGDPIPDRTGPGVIISTAAPNDDMAYLVRDDGSTVAAARPAPGWIQWTGAGFVSIDDATVWVSDQASASGSGAGFRALSPLG